MQTSWRRIATGVLARYVTREIAVPSLLALTLISFLAVGNELRERMELLPMEHIVALDIARLTMYFIPSLATYVVPITYMMGILLAFGRLTEQNEITAMKAAGIPMKRVIIPVIIGGAILSVASFFVQDSVQPMAMRRAMEMIGFELPRRLTVDSLPPGVMHSVGDWRLYIGGKDEQTGAMSDVEILVPDKKGRETIYYAKSAQVTREGDETKITLKRCICIFPQEGGDFAIQRSGTVEMVAPMPLTRAMSGQRRLLTLRECIEKEKELTVAYENATTATRQDAKSDLRKMRWEISERISLALFAFAVSFLAAPLAARVRHGARSYSFAMGAAILLVYFPLWIVMEPRGLHGLGDVILRASVPNIVLLLAGTWAVWRVDSV